VPGRRKVAQQVDPPAVGKHDGGPQLVEVMVEVERRTFGNAAREAVGGLAQVVPHHRRVLFERVRQPRDIQQHCGVVRPEVHCAACHELRRGHRHRERQVLEGLEEVLQRRPIRCVGICAHGFT
jgi:hypothetical protein